ncbi:MAG TPA: hypothetical protein VIE42_14965 [Steroidobacteraceae bacterium]
MHLPLRPLISLLSLTLAAGGIAACTPKSAATAEPPAAAEYRLKATIQDLMEGLIDPSADALWDSVAYISRPSGIEDRRPRSDEEWKAVRGHAVMLIEGGNLLSMPGRLVAADLANNAAPGPGELSHVEIQQRVTTTHNTFVQLAHGLQDAGAKALAAIDVRDAQALMDAGATIDSACEACHVTYWYPNQQRP